MCTREAFIIFCPDVHALKCLKCHNKMSQQSIIENAATVAALRRQISRKLNNLRRNRNESIERFRAFIQPLRTEKKTASSWTEKQMKENDDDLKFKQEEEDRITNAVTMAGEKDVITDDTFSTTSTTAREKRKSLADSLLKVPELDSETLESVLGTLSDGELKNLDSSENGIQLYGYNLHLGKALITIKNRLLEIDDDDIQVRANNLRLPTKYNLTEGLVNLIFQREPVNYDENDLKSYQQLAFLSNLFSCTRSNTVYKSSSKWQLVEPFYKQMKDQVGKGASLLFRKYSPTNLKYQYYNSPNQLVNRLRLLYNAQKVGHTNTDFEIRTIVQELIHTGVIY
jgi:hypothetical protein